ncbi:hypothetical protein, partial [Streptomyces sp. SID5910]|uniref:wHTH domain-containing protein n=1 Tax=Streptomyces sp. SID5910 TaxID=2690312 RepID=UPI00136843A9
MTEPHDYWTALARLVRLAEHPQAASVCAAMKQHSPRDEAVPPDNTVSGWVDLRIIPRRDDELKLFLDALQQIARQRQRDPALRVPTWQQWQRMAREARQQRRTDGAKQRQVTAPALPDWADDVANTPVWKLVRPERGERREALRTQAQEFARRLAAAYEEARVGLDDDPWLDHGSGRRTAARVNRIVLHLWDRGDGFLEPAEAALVALLPFLHQAHRARTALRLRDVDPTDLGQQAAPSEVRRMYEVVVRAHERLARRAEMGTLKDRTDGRPEIGWWLFHQWVKRQPGRIDGLLPAPGDLDDLRVVLDPDLLLRLLSCAQAGPHELFDPARADHLRAHPFDLDFHGRDFQGVRERLVGPLFALAHHLAIEATDLSSVIVRHVGIPDALDLRGFLGTVATAKWRFTGDDVALQASCSHPAAVAALTEHTRSLEPLLRSVRHAGVPEFGGLPLYTRADDVREVDEAGRPVTVGGVIRFRIDEERVQELLMGENLYRDRSLAIRELYQNALDACRYRRARTQAADPHSPYRGRIEFEQGWDEEEGRHYLECRDNGVGMDELTLSEVFSQAGIRFTDLPRFQEERLEWAGRGVTMHPNSRFGIGVLSYFMLADEIRVTTCHMDAVEGRPREITVLITGPGHYFRVRSTGHPGTIGTTVRLYLRDGDRAPSCVHELRRLLGIAEFDTTAAHGTRRASWAAETPRPREALGIRPDGYNAHGHLATWSDGTDGQVVWCRDGGGLLVDGIHCEPRVRRGILSGPGGEPILRGAVVNLAGASRPRRLSVDRTEILDDDICRQVEHLVRGALPTLLAADPPILDHAWLTEVADGSPRLADLITEAAGRAGFEWEVDGRTASVAVTGFFPPDPDIIGSRDVRDDSTRQPRRRTPYAMASDSFRLWRLLAHRPHPVLTALAGLVPELDQVAHVLPALPTDALIGTRRDIDARKAGWSARERTTPTRSPAFAALIAATCGITYREAVSRTALLGLDTPGPSEGDPDTDEINRALMSRDLVAMDFTYRGAPSATGTVAPGHLLRAHFEFGIGVGEAAQRMRDFGFTVPDLDPVTEEADELALRLLSTGLDGRPPWLGADAAVSAAHLVGAHHRFGVDIRRAAGWLRAFGLTVLGEEHAAEHPEETRRLLSREFRNGFPLHPASGVRASDVLAIAARTDRPVGDVVGDLRSLGYRVSVSAAQEALAPALLREYEEYGWTSAIWGAMVGDRSAPPGLVLHTAFLRGVDPHEMAAEIGAMGFALPTQPAAPREADLAMLRQPPGGVAPWRQDGAVVSVADVVLIALDTGLPPAEVVSRLRLYGLLPPHIPMPTSVQPSDVTLLTPAAHPYARRADAAVPLRDVLRIAALIGASPRQVTERLEAFGFTTRVTGLPGHKDTFLGRLADQGHLRLDRDGPVPLYEVLASAARLSVPAEVIVEKLTSLGLEV